MEEQNCSITPEYDSYFSWGKTPFQENGKWGVRHENGTFFIPCRWDDIKLITDSLLLVREGEKWGIIDETGTLVIPCQWDEIKSFSALFESTEYEDFSLMLSSLNSANFYPARVKHNGKWGLIDETGTLVTPCQWDRIESSWDEITAAMLNSKYALIDITGTLVTPCQWDDAEIGYREIKVKLDGKWGLFSERLIDKENDIIKYTLTFPCQWEEIEHFNDTTTYFVKRDGKWGVIDIDNDEFIIPCQWDWIDGFFINDIEYELIAEKDGNYTLFSDSGKPLQHTSINCQKLFSICRNGKYGLFDRFCNLRSPFQWDKVTDLYEGHSLAGVMRDGKWGLIDETGTLVSPCQWDEIDPFFDTSTYAVNRDGKWGVIDNTGTQITPCQWDDVSINSIFIKVKRNGKWGLIDKTDTQITPCTWHEIRPFCDGRAAVRYHKKWGFLNESGKLISLCQWDRIENFDEGHAIVFRDGKKYLINKFGAVVRTYE